MRSTHVAALVMLCVGATTVRASDDTPAAPEPQEKLTRLSYDWTVDGIVTGSLAVSTLTLLLLNNKLAPLDCKWCEPGTIDGNISRSVLWSNPTAANSVSNVMQFAIPVGVMGFGLIQGYLHDDSAAGWSAVLLITEATSLAMLVNVIVKTVSDANVSFFGGHTTFVFAVVVSGSTLFFMQGMPGAPWVLGVGLAAASFTAYLRMAAGKHYLSDTLVGVGVGSLIGWAVPYLFHRPGRGAPQAGDLLPAPGGVAIAW
jgi:membrane-associated phospholipid phosphatase